MDSKSIIMIEKIKRELEKLLEKDPTFTGNIKISFCLGGISGIEKKENLKIK